MHHQYCLISCVALRFARCLQVTLNSDGYNAESGSSNVGIGSSGSDDTITPADSITDVIQSSPYDRHAGTSWDSSLLLLVTLM